MCIFHASELFTVIGPCGGRLWATVCTERNAAVDVIKFPPYINFLQSVSSDRVLVKANQQVSHLVVACAGAVLAGGRSLRMGQPKLLVRLWDGRTMIEHALQKLLSVWPRAVIVGDATVACADGDRVRQIPDRHPGLGPLAGLDALLASGIAESYVVMACDQVRLSETLVRKIAEGDSSAPHFFRSGKDSFHPLPVYLPASALPVVQRMLASSDRSLRALAANLPVQWLSVSAEDEDCLTSVNTPEELANVNRWMSEAGRAD